MIPHQNGHDPVPPEADSQSRESLPVTGTDYAQFSREVSQEALFIGTMNQAPGIQGDGLVPSTPLYSYEEPGVPADQQHQSPAGSIPDRKDPCPGNPESTHAPLSHADQTESPQPSPVRLAMEEPLRIMAEAAKVVNGPGNVSPPAPAPPGQGNPPVPDSSFKPAETGGPASAATEPDQPVESQTKEGQAQETVTHETIANAMHQFKDMVSLVNFMHKKKKFKPLLEKIVEHHSSLSNG